MEAVLLELPEFSSTLIGKLAPYFRAVIGGRDDPPEPPNELVS
jgi:hypothetical protein